MANKIKFRRGTKANLPTLDVGEIGFCTDTRETYIGSSGGNVNIGGGQWLYGAAMSGTSSATGAYSYSACPAVKTGDFYLNTSYGYVYVCTTAGSGTSAKWTYKLTIKGSNGSSAGFGTPTASVDANTGTPSVTVTSSGSNTSKVFNFAFKNLKGEKGSTGQRGSKWYSGTAMSGTSATTGAYTWSDSEQKYVGDMYLNTSYGYVYRCTTAGSGTAAKWTYQGGIKGAKGDAGEAGSDGDLSAVYVTIAKLHNIPEIILDASSWDDGYIAANFDAVNVDGGLAYFRDAPGFFDIIGQLYGSAVRRDMYLETAINQGGGAIINIKRALDTNDGGSFPDFYLSNGDVEVIAHW